MYEDDFESSETYFVHMDIYMTPEPIIIDGLGEERRKLATLQHGNINEALQMSAVLIMEINKLGFSLVSNGADVKLVPMPFEVFMKTIARINDMEEAARQASCNESTNIANENTQSTPKPSEKGGSDISK